MVVGLANIQLCRIKCGSDDMKKLTLSIQAAESSHEQVQNKLEKPE